MRRFSVALFRGVPSLWSGLSWGDRALMGLTAGVVVGVPTGLGFWIKERVDKNRDYNKA